MDGNSSLAPFEYRVWFSFNTGSPGYQAHTALINDLCALRLYQFLMRNFAAHCLTSIFIAPRDWASYLSGKIEKVHLVTNAVWSFYSY